MYAYALDYELEQLEREPTYCPILLANLSFDGSTDNDLLDDLGTLDPETLAIIVKAEPDTANVGPVEHGAV